MRRARAATMAGGALAVLMLATSASSATMLTVTSPGVGSVIDRSENPNFLATGTVAFGDPEPTTMTYYLRRDQCGAPQGEDDIDDSPRLSVEPGSGEQACASGFNGIPNEAFSKAGLNQRGEDYPAVDGFRLTLNPLENVVGTIVLGADMAGAGQATVDVKLTGKRYGSNATIQLGGASTTLDIDPAASTQEFPFEIDLPDEYDKVDFKAFNLGLSVRGLTAYYGFVNYDGASFIDVPVYSGSFTDPEPIVSIAVDNGPFSSDDVTLSADETTWEAIVTTPARGTSRKLHVRATQGNSAVGTTVTRTFRVVD